MLLVAPVSESKRIEPNGEAEGLTGIEKLKIARSVVPAVTHVDYSARIQTVDESRHGRYCELLAAFERRHRLPGAHQYQLQRARGADCLHAAASGTLLSGNQC